MSRISAMLAVLLLILGVPAAYAASSDPSPPPPSGGSTLSGDPITAATLELRDARVAALTAYDRARRSAGRAGIAVHSPRLILRTSSIDLLRRARRTWVRRGQHFARTVARRERVVRAALRQRGTPYLWGGASPAGFDCSGLVMWAYRHAGISLPHSSYALIRRGRHVARRALRPGDLVFSEAGGHVGIYVGHGRVVHAPHAGTGVSLAPLRSWSITAIRRVI